MIRGRGLERDRILDKVRKLSVANKGIRSE
jgi:hypothetical protein